MNGTTSNNLKRVEQRNGLSSLLMDWKNRGFLDEKKDGETGAQTPLVGEKRDDVQTLMDELNTPNMASESSQGQKNENSRVLHSGQGPLHRYNSVEEMPLPQGELGERIAKFEQLMEDYLIFSSDLGDLEKNLIELGKANNISEDEVLSAILNEGKDIFHPSTPTARKTRMLAQVSSQLVEQSNQQKQNRIEYDQALSDLDNKKAKQHEMEREMELVLQNTLPEVHNLQRIEELKAHISEKLEVYPQILDRLSNLCVRREYDIRKILSDRKKRAAGISLEGPQSHATEKPVAPKEVSSEKQQAVQDRLAQNVTTEGNVFAEPIESRGETNNGDVSLAEKPEELKLEQNDATVDLAERVSVSSEDKTESSNKDSEVQNITPILEAKSVEGSLGDKAGEIELGKETDTVSDQKGQPESESAKEELAVTLAEEVSPAEKPVDPIPAEISEPKGEEAVVSDPETKAPLPAQQEKVQSEVKAESQTATERSESEQPGAQTTQENAAQVGLQKDGSETQMISPADLGVEQDLPLYSLYHIIAKSKGSVDSDAVSKMAAQVAAIRKKTVDQADSFFEKAA